MSLVICVECGKKYSDKSPTCPECACPTKFNIEELQSDNITCKECGVDYETIVLSCPICGCPTSHNKQNENMPAEIAANDINHLYETKSTEKSAVLLNQVKPLRFVNPNYGKNNLEKLNSRMYKSTMVCLVLWPLSIFSFYGNLASEALQGGFELNKQDFIASILLQIGVVFYCCVIAYLINKFLLNGWKAKQGEKRDMALCYFASIFIVLVINLTTALIIYLTLGSSGIMSIVASSFAGAFILSAIDTYRIIRHNKFFIIIDILRNQLY